MSIFNGFSSFNNPIGDALQNVYGGIFPEQTPQRTEMTMGALGSQSGDATMDLYNGGVAPAVAALGGAGTVDFSSLVTSGLSSFFADSGGGNIAFTDASLHSTQEQLHDQPIDNPIWCQPYADGTQNQFGQYMPLFNLRGSFTSAGAVAQLDRAVGFHTLATHVLINQIQGQLKQAERDADLLQRVGALRQRSSGAIISSGREALAGEDGPGAKRRALPAAGMPYSNSDNAVSARVLKTLRELGAIKAQDLYRKIEYLGPIGKSEDSNNGCTADRAYMTTVTDRIFNYTLYSRGKIYNIFATTPHEGDSLYFSVANYSRDQLQSLGASTGFAFNQSCQPGGLLNRAYGGGGFVGNATRAATADEFAQVRGWADTESLHFMKPTHATEWMDTQKSDRFYTEREHRVAVEYRKYSYNPDTDRVEADRDLVAEEGLQEALANIPDIVIEEYTTAAAIIPVGRIKSPYVPATTATAILNAHYDHAACAAMDHFDIYQNHAG